MSAEPRVIDANILVFAADSGSPHHAVSSDLLAIPAF